ncbi:DEP domain-containing mTOR-interacting protein-like [Liolophura sinensis]|uniref:DEP domain-containing mTOR-interacting protein-like n=1 Tax=Liolophura sinensis TaxID=3198878 RepID=UPI0031598A86
MCSKFYAWIAGEQLRIRMHTENLNLIKDRRYRFRTYQNCFKATETIDWLLETQQCPTREAAVFVLNILHQYGVLHHVCDDHNFKDEMLFYRFRKDDRTWKHGKESQVFHRGEKIFNWLISKRLRSFRDDLINNLCGHTLNFYGKQLVDWLIKTGEATSTQDAVRIGKDLVNFGIIQHIYDEYHFRDDWVPYTFQLNYRQQISLSSILKAAVKASGVGNSKIIHISQSHFSQLRATRRRKQSSESETENVGWQPGRLSRSLSMESKESRGESSDGQTEGCMSNRSSCNEPDLDLSSPEDMSPSSPKSVLIRHASVQELEDPDTPYIRKLIRVFSDSVGYGCVIRGDSPTYVQTVDPSGPAAAAGIKVRQYIYSVNGEKVLDKNHKYVAKAIRSNSSCVDLVVMSHVRDASL